MADRDEKVGQKQDEPGEQHRAGYGKGLGNSGTAGNQDQDFAGQGGFVDRAFEPGGRYDEETAEMEEASVPEGSEAPEPAGVGGGEGSTSRP